MLKYALVGILLFMGAMATGLAEWDRFSWDKVAVPALPDMVFEQTHTPQDDVLDMSGAWVVQDGYEYTPWTAVSLRCVRSSGYCAEALGTLLRHDSGEDLEAEAVLHEIEEWSEGKVVIKAHWRGELERKIVIDLKSKAASLVWKPDGETSESKDIGKAYLAGG